MEKKIGGETTEKSLEDLLYSFCLSKQILSDSAEHQKVIYRLKQAVQSTSSTQERRVGFALILLQINLKKTQASTLSFVSEFGNLMYQSEKEIFFSYHKEEKKEKSYLDTKQAWEKLDPDPMNQILMHFVPCKFKEENRIYTMRFDDLTRIAKKQNWASLPDPKNCYCWIPYKLNETEALFPKEGQSEERSPRQANSKLQQNIGLELFKRRNTNARHLKRGSLMSCRESSRGMSKFYNQSPNRQEASPERKFEFQDSTPSQAQEVQITKSKFSNSSGTDASTHQEAGQSSSKAAPHFHIQVGSERLVITSSGSGSKDLPSGTSSLNSREEMSNKARERKQDEGEEFASEEGSIRDMLVKYTTGVKSNQRRGSKLTTLSLNT